MSDEHTAWTGLWNERDFLKHDATATMEILFPVAHTFNHYSTTSDLELDHESDHAFKINRSQISWPNDF